MTISSSGGDGSRQSAPQADNLTAASATPAGLASMRSLIWRRRAMLSLCAALYGVILYFTALFLGDGGVGGDFWSGFSTLDVLLLICVALSAPWTVLGFLNASIGVALMFGKNDAAAWWAPLATPPQDGAAPEGRTAVIMVGAKAAAESASLEDTLADTRLKTDQGFTEIHFGFLPLGLDRDFVIRRAWEEATGAVAPPR